MKNKLLFIIVCMNYGPRAARAARAARYFIKYSLMRVFLRGGAKQRAGRAGVPGYIHLQSGLPLTKQHIYNRLFSFQKIIFIYVINIMTSDAISKMNFKVGKYLIDGDNYRSTIENLLNEHIDDDEMVELTFQFFASTITTQGALTKIEALARIAESCAEIDKFPDHLKEAIKDTYIFQIEPYMREMIEEAYNLDEMKKKDSDIL